MAVSCVVVTVSSFLNIATMVRIRWLPILAKECFLGLTQHKLKNLRPFGKFDCRQLLELARRFTNWEGCLMVIYLQWFLWVFRFRDLFRSVQLWLLLLDLQEWLDQYNGCIFLTTVEDEYTWRRFGFRWSQPSTVDISANSGILASSSNSMILGFSSFNL